HGLISDWIMDLVALTATDVTAADTTGAAKAGAVAPTAAVAAATASALSMHAMRADVDGSGAAVPAGYEEGWDGGDGGGVEMSTGPEVMTTLAQLNAAADAFVAAVLAVTPAPGVSAGVPDYANVLAVEEAARAAWRVTTGRPGVISPPEPEHSGGAMSDSAAGDIRGATASVGRTGSSSSSSSSGSRSGTSDVLAAQAAARYPPPALRRSG
ncbi:hypothetical protein Vretimale_17108, partial [Volvox reticuliferus]